MFPQIIFGALKRETKKGEIIKECLRDNKMKKTIPMRRGKRRGGGSWGQERKMKWKMRDEK